MIDTPPKIEFPCRYPIKVIVETGDGIIEQVVEIIRGYDPRITVDNIVKNPSRNGSYVSIRFEMWAEGTPQLELLFTDLKQCAAVRMVL